MDMKLFETLPTSFAQQIKQDTEKHLSREMSPIIRILALGLFNEALWKLQKGSWVFERVFQRTFVARQVDVVRYAPNNNTKPEELKNGLLRLSGDCEPPDDVYELTSLTESSLLDSEEDTGEIFPIIESLEKTLELLQTLHPNKAVLLVNSKATGSQAEKQ